MQITTESGSIYILDTAAKTWERVKHSLESSGLRSESGDYTSISKIRVGSRLRMVCPPFANGDARFIMTTPIVSIEGA